MALLVHIGACQGHGACFQHCPEIFVPDVEGFSTVALEHIPPEFDRAVRTAEAACPEGAITVKRDGDG
jgi:ferredoxin